MKTRKGGQLKKVLKAISSRKKVDRRIFLGTGAAALGGVIMPRSIVMATENQASLEHDEELTKAIESVGRTRIESAVRSACDWLTDIAQVKTEGLTNKDRSVYGYDSWRGAFRDSYSPRRAVYPDAGR